MNWETRSHSGTVTATGPDSSRYLYVGPCGKRCIFVQFQFLSGMKQIIEPSNEEVSTYLEETV